MNHVDVGGLRLAYDDSGHPVECGDGRRDCVAVLLHGWGNGRAMMRRLATGLADRYRTVVLDQPGHGDSDPPPAGRAADLLSVPGQAHTSAAALDRLDITTAVLVGHSSGGAVAIELAARRPGLARAVVGLDATIPFAPQVLAGTEALLAALRGPDWRDAMATHIRRGYRACDDPALMTAELKQLARMSQEVLAALPETIGDWDEQAALRSLAARDIPLLHVDASMMVRLSDLRRLVPNVRIEQIIGGGHMQLIGHPELAIAAMTEFLEDTRTPYT